MSKGNCWVKFANYCNTQTRTVVLRKLHHSSGTTNRPFEFHANDQHVDKISFASSTAVAYAFIVFDEINVFKCDSLHLVIAGEESESANFIYLHLCRTLNPLNTPECLRRVADWHSNELTIEHYKNFLTIFHSISVEQRIFALELKSNKRHETLKSV